MEIHLRTTGCLSLAIPVCEHTMLLATRHRRVRLASQPVKAGTRSTTYPGGWKAELACVPDTRTENQTHDR